MHAKTTPLRDLDHPDVPITTVTEPSSTRGFHSRALRWLRDDMRLATQVVPGDRGEDPREPTRVPGFFGRPSRAGALGFAGLWTITAGIVLSMVGVPRLSAATKQAIHGAGWLGMALGVAFLVAGVIMLRRHRDRALVELRPAAAGPATKESVAALHRDAGGAVTWIVAEQGFEPTALATAAELGVRCFERGRHGFTEAIVSRPPAP